MPVPIRDSDVAASLTPIYAGGKRAVAGAHTRDLDEAGNEIVCINTASANDILQTSKRWIVEANGYPSEHMRPLPEADGELLGALATDMECDNSSYDYVAEVRLASAAQFDGARAVVVYNGQDICGDGVLMVFATRVDELFLHHRSVEAIVAGLPCGSRDAARATDSACAAVTACIAQALAQPAVQSKLTAIAQELLSEMSTALVPPPSAAKR